MNVEKETIFKEFCRDRNLAPGSVKLYKLALDKYTDFHGMSLEQLINEAEDEEDRIPRLRKRTITKRLSEFKEDLDSGKLSQNYVNHQLLLVRSFYGEFDIQLPRNRRRKTRSDRKEETIEDLPTMEEINKSLDKSNAVYKAIILLMFSSGMSRSEVASLTFKHFYDGIPLKRLPKNLGELIDKLENEENLILYWKLKRVKTGKHYFTFSSPEASDRIFDYLTELHREYPDYNPQPEDTFFRPFNIPINPESISQYFKRINRRAGLIKNRNSLTVRPHALRKLFATILEKNKFPHLYTRWLMGHSIDSTTASYFKADPEAVKQEYITILDHLTTDKVEIKVVNQYEDIKQEVKNIKEFNEELVTELLNQVSKEFDKLPTDGDVEKISMEDHAKRLNEMRKNLSGIKFKKTVPEIERRH